VERSPCIALKRARSQSKASVVLWLTDRETAEAVQSRIDWKYALGLEITGLLSIHRKPPLGIETNLKVRVPAFVTFRK